MNRLLIPSLLIAMTNYSNGLGQDNPDRDHCTDQSRPVVILEGNSTMEENRSGLVNTSFNLYNWISTAVVGPHASRAISLFGSDICTMGGTVKGLVPDSLTWLQVHDDVGGHAFKIDVDSGSATLLDARVHNVEDGFKPRETPYYGNTGTMVVRGAYMTKMRDDCIENDGFMPGRIEDCLFDGVFVFYSEQEQSRLPPPHITIGPDEDPTVYFSRVYVRTDVTNAPGTILHYNAGHWFKLMPKNGGAVLHKLRIDNSVFAISAVPKNKYGDPDWRRTAFPKSTVWSGENYILWLGPGEYGGVVPAGVKFLEGKEARQKWEELRRSWAAAHGYVPSELTATPGESQVEVQWNSASRVASYSVKRSTNSGGPYKTIASKLTGNSYLDKGLASEKTYYYIVSALDYCDVEISTTEVSATL